MRHPIFSMFLLGFSLCAIGQAGVVHRRTMHWDERNLSNQLRQMEEELSIITDQLTVQYTKGQLDGITHAERAIIQALQGLDLEPKTILVDADRKTLEAITHQAARLASDMDQAALQIDGLNRRLETMEKSMQQFLASQAASLEAVKMQLASSMERPAPVTDQRPQESPPATKPAVAQTPQPAAAVRDTTHPEKAATSAGGQSAKQEKNLRQVKTPKAPDAKQDAPKDFPGLKKISFDKFKELQGAKKISFLNMSPKSNIIKGHYLNRKGDPVKFITEAPPGYTQKNRDRLIKSVTSSHRGIPWSRLVPIVLLPILIILFVLKKSGRI